MYQELKDSANGKSWEDNPVALSTYFSPQNSHSLSWVNTKIASIAAISHQDNYHIQAFRLDSKIYGWTWEYEECVKDVDEGFEWELLMINRVPCPSWRPKTIGTIRSLYYRDCPILRSTCHLWSLSTRILCSKMPQILRKASSDLRLPTDKSFFLLFIYKLTLYHHILYWRFFFLLCIYLFIAY